MTVYADSLTDVVYVKDLGVSATKIGAVIHGEIDEQVQLSISPSQSWGFQEILAEHMGLHLSQIQQWFKNATVSEKLNLKQRMSLVGTYHLTQRERLVLKSVFGTMAAALIHERLGLTSHMAQARALILHEHLSIAMRQSSHGYYSLSMRERAAFHDMARRGLGGLIHDILVLDPAILPVHRAMAQVVDELHLADGHAQHLMITVIEEEGIEFAEADLLKAIYRGQLHEALGFALDIVEPSGAITTWATNVRTGAVTEYLNYAFNSFAIGPNGTYVGATGDGLYELVGKDDQGSPVVADLITGLMEMTGSQFTGFKAAYIAVRGEGPFYLKLVSGDDKTYVYRAETANLRTTRVNVGKGLRARFFTFELISTGQDFDLLSLEFLPITSTRRV